MITINNDPVLQAVIIIGFCFFIVLGLFFMFRPEKTVKWYGRIFRFQWKMMGGTEDKLSKMRVPFDKIIYKKEAGQFILDAEKYPGKNERVIHFIRVLGCFMAGLPIITIICNRSLPFLK